MKTCCTPFTSGLQRWAIQANASILQGGKMARAKFGTIFGSPALNQDTFACSHSEGALPSITVQAYSSPNEWGIDAGLSDLGVNIHTGCIIEHIRVRRTRANNQTKYREPPVKKTKGWKWRYIHSSKFILYKFTWLYTFHKDKENQSPTNSDISVFHQLIENLESSQELHRTTGYTIKPSLQNPPIKVCWGGALPPMRGELECG